MRALTFHGPGHVACEAVPDPRLEGPGDALVRVEVAGLCGSDLHVYHGRETGLDAGTVLGHELVGEIVEIGPAVRGLAVGDRVVAPFTTSCGGCYYCRRGLTSRCPRGQLFGWVEAGRGLAGAQAEMVRVPLAATTLVRVPPEIPGELALLAGDVLATGLFAADRSEAGPGSTVVVLGCGAVGLAAVVGALERGAERVFAVDAVAERLALAARFGAEARLAGSPELAGDLTEATEGRGADCVIEAVGSAEATRLAVDLARPGATLSAVGVHTEASFPVRPGAIYDKNLTYRLGRCPARAYLGRALGLVAGGRHPLAALVSHRLPLGDGPRAYDLFARRAEGAVKIVFRP